MDAGSIYLKCEPKVRNEKILLDIPHARSVLIVAPGLEFTTLHKKPGWWHRLWQRWLLGFEWRDI